MSKAIALLLAFAIALPHLARAADEPDGGTPKWVPWAFAATVIVAGVTYVVRHLHTADARPPDPKEEALSLIRFIASPAERRELESLDSASDIKAYLDRFFLDRDPTPGTARNEFREEHEARHVAARRLFGEGGLYADRIRVWMLYGPPDERLCLDFIGTGGEPGVGWKAAELWEYRRPSGGVSLPELLDPATFIQIFHASPPQTGRMLFLFADDTGAATYDQVFSTEPGEDVDPRIYSMHLTRLASRVATW